MIATRGWYCPGSELFSLNAINSSFIVNAAKKTTVAAAVAAAISD